jgi:hypothetical protein
MTIAACEVAVVILSLATTVVPVSRHPLAPMLWWLAVSVSLDLADRRGTPSSPGTC